MARLLTRLSPLASLVALTLTTAMPSCVDVDTSMPHKTIVKDWRDEIIYQVMIDRFEDGDKSNNWDVKYNTAVAFHGGDWQGLIDRLDYIEDLGVTALWISPVVKNVENDAGFYSYHGYWTQDFMSVNPHFGDMAKLKELVRKCHERNIKVILDIVTNHVGQLFYYDINNNGSPDEGVQGGGGSPYRSENADQASGIVHVSEWDPDYDFRGIYGVTSLGENGLAPLRWLNWPNVHRVPPQPEEFANFDWFNAKGRVTAWESNWLANERPRSTVSSYSYEYCMNREATRNDYWCKNIYYVYCTAGDDYNNNNNPIKWDNNKNRYAYCNQDGNCCQNYAHKRLREQEILGDFPGGLKDLRTSREDVRQALVDVFSYWIEEADFDGFRIDTLKHQEPDFFEYFAPRIRKAAKDLGKNNFFMFGEAFDGNDELLGEYTQGQGVDSVFYFSAKFQIFENVFGEGQSSQKIKELYNGRKAPFEAKYDDANYPDCEGENCDPNYPKRPYRLAGKPRYNDQPKENGPIDENGNGLTSQQLLVHFMDNHDVARILFSFNQFNDRYFPNEPPEIRREDARKRLHNALTFLLTTDGIPCIYYGTEQDFDGGPDPSNREDMWNTGFKTSGATFKLTQKLIKLRKKYAPLRRGEFKFIDYQDNLVAFERVNDGENVLVLINSSNDRGTAIGVTGLQTSFSSGTQVYDVLNDQGPYTVGSGGKLDIDLAARGDPDNPAARILVTQP